MKFTWMKEQGGAFAVEPMCRALEVSKAGYYAWLKRPVSRRARRRAELAVKIKRAHQQSRRIYGSPRIHQELIAGGEKVCRNTVARIMRREQIRSIIPRRFVVRTTDSKHDHPVHENRLNREFYAEKPNKKWCADITYVPTEQGMLYLAAVIDLHSRKIVGWSMSEQMPVDLVADALKMALARRQPSAELLHHSDRGTQYACGVYQFLLAEHGITCSMSRIGNCYDNAVMESFFGTLKSECVYPHGPYATFQQARRSIFDYLEVFYNRQRRHSSLGYLSPEEYEASINRMRTRRQSEDREGRRSTADGAVVLPSGRHRTISRPVSSVGKEREDQMRKRSSARRQQPRTLEAAPRQPKT
jgi:putative transposase